MIKIKSILSKPHKDDGTRICVMRYVKDFYKYDEHMICLAPSKRLLNKYRSSLSMSWEEFRAKYVWEMMYQSDKIEALKRRSEAGEVITLLCWEKNDKFCHRSILKKIIDKSKFI